MEARVCCIGSEPIEHDAVTTATATSTDAVREAWKNALPICLQQRTKDLMTICLITRQDSELNADGRLAYGVA